MLLLTLVSLLIFAYSIILHEIAHGWVADRLGDPTARLSGRLTLDPRPHIDPLMTIVLPLFLAIIGGPVFGAAKPVPVDPFNFREGRKDMAIVALAGPLTNILIAVILSLILRLILSVSGGNEVAQVVGIILAGAIKMNLFLAFFNLFPLPPLDGYNVIGGILPESLVGFWMSLGRFGFGLIFLFIFFFQNVIFSFVGPLTSLFIRILLP